MGDKIIDLRNKNEESAQPQQQTLTSGRGEKTKDLITWSALEYEFRARSGNWWLGPGVIALLFILFGILTRNYFFIAFVTIAYAVFIMYARRPPREISCALTQEGVRAGGKFYPFTELKSFWIFETSGSAELSLETSKTLSPYVRLPLGNVNPGAVRHALRKFIPEEEHKEFFSDQLARKI